MSAPRENVLTPLILLCLAATWLIWGSTYLAIKWALVSFPPFIQMATRFLFAGGLLLAWMRIVRGAAWPNRRQWRHALWVGGLMLGGGMGCTAFAEQSVDSGLVVVFIAVMPLMIAALNMLWGVFPSRLEAAGIIAGLTGVVMLTRGAGFSASPAGLVAIVIATASWSTGSVMSQRRWPLAPGAMGFSSEMLCGGLVLLVLAGFNGEFPRLAANWPFEPKSIMAWGYLVVFGSLMAFNAYMILLDRVSAGLAASYSFVNPVIALLLGVWLAGETVTSYEWTAAAVILFGVVLLISRRWR